MYCNILYLHMYYQIYELCLYIFSSDRFFIVLFFSVIVLVLVIDESLNILLLYIYQLMFP